MRILLTGSTGRLGGAFLFLWGGEASGHDLRAASRAQLDLSRPDALAAGLDAIWRQWRFDVLINTAAMSSLEDCLDQPELAQAVNVESPAEMARFAAKRGVRMIHFSTDYVFGGEREGRCYEADEARPRNVYGRTKLEGERRVRSACPEAVIARVSWLFGPLHGAKPTHFDHVLERAASGHEQTLISDKYSVPTFTYDVVEWSERLLQSEHAGVFHLCNAGQPESWFSYGRQICRLAAQAGLPVDGAQLLASSLREAVFFRDPRPVHTAMVPSRLIETGLAHPRHWLEAAGDYLKMR